MLLAVNRLAAIAGLLLATQVTAAELNVEVDSSETPDLAKWASDSGDLIREWHPRIANLLPSPEFTAPTQVRLVMRKTDEGVAATSGNVINVSSHWIEKHPEDIGLVVHELVHVVQSYPPRGGPFWVTEGIADYIRYAIYEGKPLSQFPVERRPRGYERGYGIAGGFLLWLETGPAPGIVNRLNTACRQRKYNDEIFTEATGRSLEELWNEYAGLKAE